ncbi:hypothetical protein CN103_13205 [Sinorhizobium meliloti]|nr:hypothetical protein CN103_13205 [Sinorhizobium meliloti]
MQVAHLSKHYKLGSGPCSPKREFRAVDDVSFTLRRGEIVGESGSGKSSHCTHANRTSPCAAFRGAFGASAWGTADISRRV